jgi:hypothetical protein
LKGLSEARNGAISGVRWRKTGKWLNTTGAVRRNRARDGQQICIYLVFNSLHYGHQPAFKGGRKGWTDMKTKLMALALLAGSSMFAQSRLAVGIQVGGGYDQGYDEGYYEPAPVYAAQPPCPGPDYIWVDGYWSQNYGRRSWIAGFWNRRGYERPRYGYGYVENRNFSNRNFENRNYGGNNFRGNNFNSERRESFSRGNDRGRGREDSRGQERERGSGTNYSRGGNGFRGR